jgi:peroxiredoxin
MSMAWKPPKLTGRTASQGSAGLVLLVIVIAVVSAVLDERGRRSPESHLVPGEPLPDYAARSLDGAEVSIGEFRGRVVLLSFWATWCSECVDQLPDLQALKDELGEQGLELISVSVDDQDRAWVQSFLDGGEHDWLNLFDDPAHINQVFGWGSRIPKTVLVNRDGTVGVWWRGRVDPTSPENRALIDEAMSGRAVWRPEG